jgi:transcriptional regulator with XRE-family HTH domain
MKTQRDKHAELFADYMIEAMSRTRLRQTDIARLAGLSRTTVSNLVGKKPSTLTGKLLLPERETVDKIAQAFGDPIAIARRAAGYSAEGETPAPAEHEPDTAADQAARAAELIEHFLTLSPEKQTELLAIIRVLKADHPELLEMMKAPVRISRAEDLTESDIEDTG